VRVLVVDDEVELADAVATGLRRQGYAVDVANGGAAALERLEVNEYDLVCLDLTMPDVDGVEVCRRVRAGIGPGPAPRVLMVTARDAVDDRVGGLDAGADDYLVKPFAFAELEARVRTLMRRDAARSGAVLTSGPITLDDPAHRATLDGLALDLSPKEFALLRYFMHNEGDVLSQEQLLEHVWDEHADPFTNTVRVTVGTLRRKLASAQSAEGDLIETVVGRGYRLVTS
jgi:DNA-binding response OmpR family regulator